jgi:peroxiredoxin
VIAGDPKPMELPRPADLARYRMRDLGPPTDPKIQYVNYAIVEQGNQVRYFLTDQNVEPWDIPGGREFDPDEYRELTLGKIQKWVVGSRNGTERELRLMSPQEAMKITKGEDLIIVASGSSGLSFRIFKYNGEREDVVAPVKGKLQSRCFDPSGKPNVEKNWDDEVTNEKAQQIVGLRKRLEILEGLGPRHELTRDQKRQVITEVESIAGLTIDVAHPFHIHINSFLVQEVRDEHGKDVTTQEIGKPIWRDTLALKQGYTYTLFMKYEDFSGSFVEHCHILDHEDHGMMEIVRIVDPSEPRATPPDIVESPGKLPIADPRKPTVALFVKGTDCPHCMSQVKEVGRSLDPSKANLVVVSSAEKKGLGDFPKGPFDLVADPGLRLFRQFGAVKDASNEPLHATIVLNPTGKTELKEIGDTPFTDFAAVRRALAPR